MLYHFAQDTRGVDVQQVIGELPEEIDPAGFGQAWRHVVERHPVLRTSFEWLDGGEPRQVVQAMQDVHLDFHYAEFDTPAAARRGLEAWLAEDRRAGFPALTAPLLRVALLRGGPARHWFVATYHHLVLDARSMTLLFREALDWHDALAGGRMLEFPPAPPYRRYIDWLQTIDCARAEPFWREHLQGITAPTALPLARSRDTGEPSDAACGELMCRLPEPAAQQVRRAAAHHGVTVNTMVQAAWALVLGRHAGEDSVVFGALRAGRHIPVEGADAIVGPMINTVPVRSTAAGRTTVGEWLRGLRAQWVAMREFEQTPLTKIQQWSGLAPGRPLFETLLNYQEPAWDAALNALGGRWAARRFDIRSRPNYPLALDAYGGAALTFKLFYERRVFDDDAAARLLGHVRVTLEALAANSASTVSDLPLLTAFERRQLARWNRTRRDYPREACVHTLFERHAGAAADRIAISDAKTALTYGGLNASANRLARRLRVAGVGPETLVAVCTTRSPAMLVAWLAVLKAGGAFVPLDPGYPKERLAFQIADCGARVLLTQPEIRSALPAVGPEVAIMDVVAEAQEPGDSDEGNLPPATTSRNLAYVIYTSGSTGQPKGVQVEHRALMNLVMWHQRFYHVTPKDRATQLASPAFDASIWETWPYLTAGASVHIPDDETRLSPALLWRWMAGTKITLSFLPTPLAEAAMDEPWPDTLVLRALLTGGDKLKRRPPENFPCALVNHYGPTESAVVSTCAPVSVTDLTDPTPAIGRPIANTTAYVLDAAGRLVPVGVPGELHVGGESLARGYLHRPDLDAEKFITLAPAPAAAFAECHLMDDTSAGERVYRTGDLVRWNARGELEFLGRIDGQVKIRGCRIEPGEVEATLHQHPAVRESVVLAQADAPGGTQLIAFVIGRDGESDAVGDELLVFLRTKLPPYMVPAACRFVERWPLTPNGKIDRDALLALDIRPAPRPRSMTPRTSMEQGVARIWSDVLGRTTPGLDDNFFELGGHSLLAAQVIARLNATLPTHISVRVLFDHPTLAAFARELDRRVANQAAAPRATGHRLIRRTARPELEVVRPN